MLLQLVNISVIYVMQKALAIHLHVSYSESAFPDLNPTCLFRRTVKCPLTAKGLLLPARSAK